MSSSSFGSNIPAPDAVQVVVVTALADESPLVRQASTASFKDIAKLNPLLVLDCCSSVSRGGRRRFGNMSGVFQVMAFAVSAIDDEDVDPGYMLNLVKIATAEMISSKFLLKRLEYAKRKGLKDFLYFLTKSLKWLQMDSAIRGRSDKVHLDLSTRESLRMDRL